MRAHHEVVKIVPTGLQRETAGRIEAASDQIRVLDRVNSAAFGGLLVSIFLIIAIDILKSFLLRRL